MEPPYKLICLDLDGTLFNSRRKISQETLNTLRSIAAGGMKVAVVTGRPGFDAKYYAKILGGNTYYIGANGGVVGSVAGDQILFQSYMQPATIRTLLDISKEIHYYPGFYATHKVIIQNGRDFLNEFYILLKGNLRNLGHIHYIPSRRQFAQMLLQKNTQVSKAAFYRLNPSQASIVKSSLAGEYEVARYTDAWYEITEKKLNKSWGIQKLAQYLSIQPSEIIAFGDSENDREMLKYAGCAVAMGNAAQPIQAVADLVADTNDRDGVAKVLKDLYGKYLPV